MIIFYFTFLKFWSQAAILLISFYIYRAEIQYCIYSILLVDYHSFCSHCSVEGFLWGPEPRFELRPAVEQADAPRRKLFYYQYSVAKIQLCKITLFPPSEAPSPSYRTLKRLCQSEKLCVSALGQQVFVEFVMAFVGYI